MAARPPRHLPRAPRRPPGRRGRGSQETPASAGGSPAAPGSASAPRRLPARWAPSPGARAASVRCTRGCARCGPRRCPPAAPTPARTPRRARPARLLRPRSRVARVTASSWSARIDDVSCSSRPTRVDLPSSTEPAVVSRSSDDAAPVIRRGPSSEVALPFAVLHGGRGQPVVGAGGAALGEPAGGDLGEDGLDGRGGGLHRAGAGRVADGSEAHRLRDDLLAAPRATPLPGGEPHAVAGEDLALMGVVDAGYRHLAPGDVVPDVKLGPVRQRERPHVLARGVPAVVEVPQLRTLSARVPAAEGVAQAHDALLGAGPVLVAAGGPQHPRR